jgi:multiple sugar transport system substrate-binding protein
MAAKVQADAGVANGFVFTGANYEGGTVLGLEFIRNAGGDVLNGDEVVIASPEAIAGLEVQRSLVADGIAPEAVANFKEDEASGAFLRGDAVFMRMWPYAYGLITDPKQSNIKQGQVSLSQVPVTADSVQPTNVGGGWNFFIDKSSDIQDGAWELIAYLSGPEQQKQLALELGYLPTRAALYDDPEVIEALPAVGLSRKTVINTTTPPVSPYYSDISLEMSEQFNANILGETTPEETANSLQSALQSIIESAS